VGQPAKAALFSHASNRPNVNDDGFEDMEFVDVGIKQNGFLQLNSLGRLSP
jgi:hypothetical protein